MAAERIACETAGAAGAAARVRELVPRGASVAEDVAAILLDVRHRGDAAVLDAERRFGGGEAPLRVPAGELEAAAAALDPALRAGLETAIVNVGAVAAAGLHEDRAVELEQGQRVTVREVPVRRAAVYAPGGRNPYPSSVVMGAVTARVAGVADVVVVAPPHPVILGAAALCGVEEVYRMGGAQAIGALAYGTDGVPRVDVIVGPGSLWVQEAKRQVADAVGIDGFAGPSDLTLIVSGDVDLEPLALDLLAQAEHGAGSLVVAVSDRPELLDALAPRLADTPGPALLVDAADPEAALAFAEALAPEHLQLAGAPAEALAPRVRSAGCVFVGAQSGTAFGDYVAGSNHVLPTDGAARFASGLSVRHFRRTMHEVRVGPGGPALARAGAPIAEAEGFARHAASMRIRQTPDS